jgi:hypothetical protein
MRKDTRERLYSIKDEFGCYKTYYREGGKRYFTLERSYHHNMLTRATNPKYREKFPTYEDCTVSDNFKNFQYFAKWCNSQAGFGNKGWVLDKDILSQDSPTYSEDTCVFIPSVINSLFLSGASKKVSGLPKGVCYEKCSGKFTAYCAQLDGRNKTVGRYTTVEEASEAYKTFKRNLVRIVYTNYLGVIDMRVSNKLLMIANGTLDLPNCEVINLNKTQTNN